MERPSQECMENKLYAHDGASLNDIHEKRVPHMGVGVTQT